MGDCTMIVKALLNIRPGAEWKLDGSDYDGLTWMDETQTKPTRQELEEEMIRVQEDYESKEYQRKRAAQYPRIEEQLDMLYHDKINGTDNWLQAVQAVKDKYPKP